MRALFVAANAVAWFVTVAWCATASAVMAQNAPGGPTADAQALFAAGDIPGCLKKISAQLGSKSVKRDSAERYDLLMLRGECLMKLKQRNPAVQSFDTAATVMKGRNDRNRAAAATALAVLVKASPDFKYPSKAQAERSGIDIIDPSSRREAMAALFQDLKARLAPDVSKALQDKSLVSTQKRLREFWELYAVEFAATGDTASTAATLQELGGHARGLIGEELERLITRLEQLSDLAGMPVWGSDVLGYRGLNTDERTELKQIADYLVQIQRTVENGRRISRALGTTGENWDVLLADCAVARDTAQEAYDRRY